MKTTDQLNSMYDANQQKALKNKLLNKTDSGMDTLINKLKDAKSQLDIQLMLSDICDNDTMLTATLYEKGVALDNIISTLTDTQN
jgi:hypothetical protein